MRDLADRRLYLCTPIRSDLAAFLESVIGAGVDVVQLRDKSADARDVLSAARTARQVCDAFDVPFILNDRPDLALEVGADGVHVGQDDAPVNLCRRILGADAIIGLSTHSLDDLEGALSTSATYLSAGPVTETPTKPGREGTGVGYASAASRRSDRPVFVTGGVTPDTVPALVEAGVRHFVVVRFLTESVDPAASARRLRQVIDEEIEQYQ